MLLKIPHENTKKLINKRCTFLTTITITKRTRHKTGSFRYFMIKEKMISMCII